MSVGSHVPVVEKQSISLLDKYITYDVLHLGNLFLNFLSISKIIEDLNRELIFSRN